MMAAFIVSFISIMAVIGHVHPESHIAAATAGLVNTHTFLKWLVSQDSRMLFYLPFYQKEKKAERFLEGMLLEGCIELLRISGMRIVGFGWDSFVVQVGLGLSYSTPIIGLLSDLMTSFAETEKEMVSVERVQQVLILTVISPAKQCKLVQCTIFPHNKVLRITGHLLSGSTDF
jgi:hypothetical protein